MTGNYRTIVADPPWEIPGKVMLAGGRRRQTTEVDYEFMSIEEISALPIEPMAADSAALFMWSTRRLFREGTAASVARAWGFEPCGEVIWGLRNSGMGTRSIANDHEPILVATRGDSPLTATEPMGVWFWRQPYSKGGGQDPQCQARRLPRPRRSLVAGAVPGAIRPPSPLRLGLLGRSVAWDGDHA